MARSAWIATCDWLNAVEVAAISVAEIKFAAVARSTFSEFNLRRRNLIRAGLQLRLERLHLFSAYFRRIQCGSFEFAHTSATFDK